MPETRSNKAIDDDIKEYFAKLIEPLSKSSQIDALHAKLEKQSKQIEELEQTLKSKDDKISQLENDVLQIKSELAQVKTKVELAARKNENLEQYTRRSSLRIYGIPPRDDEDKESVMSLVEKCHQEMGIEFSRGNIDRAHRVGAVMENPTTKAKSQAVIVKFRSWDSRAEFYMNRPKFKPEGSGRRRRFSIALDLTRERYELLKVAREKVMNYPDVKFAYADINCLLAMRMANDQVKFFSSVAELNKLLSEMKFVAHK